MVKKTIDFVDFDESLIRQLRSIFYLNSYEAKALLILLQHGTLTPADISAYGKIPKARTYDTLESLVARGFILKHKGRPVKYIARDPNKMIESVIEKLDEIHNAQIENIKKQQKDDEGIVGVLKKLYKQRAVKDDLTSYEIKGRSNIGSFLKTAISETKKEILISYNSAIDVLAEKNNLANMLSSAMSKGISVKFLTYTKPYTPDNSLKGSDIKVYPKQLVRFWVFDRTKLLIYMNDDPSTPENEEVCVYLNSPTIAAFLSEIFGVLSKDAVPLAE